MPLERRRRAPRAPGTEILLRDTPRGLRGKAPTRSEAARAREPSLSRLLEAVASERDRDAFARLFSYYAPRIKGMMRKRGADDATAEEIAQEAMLRVWHRASEFRRARGGASAWVFTIARNLYVDRVRKQRVFDLEAEVTDGDLPTDERYASRAEERRVLAALEALPPEQAEVVRASFWRGQSLSAIATEKRLPLGTVKTRARLGLARLREMFAGPGENR